MRTLLHRFSSDELKLPKAAEYHIRHKHVLSYLHGSSNQKVNQAKRGSIPQEKVSFERSPLHIKEEGTAFF